MELGNCGFTRQQVIDTLKRNGFLSAGTTFAAALHYLENPEPTDTARRNLDRLKKLKAKIQRYTHAWSELRKNIDREVAESCGIEPAALRIKERMMVLESERDGILGRALPPRAFWLVWNEQGHIPTHKHPTEDSARTEAERLARANPGQQFHVLQLLGSCTFTGVDWSDQDEMPF
jgi:hypothetical protein